MQTKNEMEVFFEDLTSKLEKKFNNFFSNQQSIEDWGVIPIFWFANSEQRLKTFLSPVLCEKCNDVVMMEMPVNKNSRSKNRRRIDYFFRYKDKNYVFRWTP